MMINDIISSIYKHNCCSLCNAIIFFSDLSFCNIIVVVEFNLNTEHARIIRANLNYLLKNVKINELPLSSYMSSYNVKIITSVEIQNITSETNPRRQVQLLLFLIARKSRRCYNQFLYALDKTGQGYLASRLREKTGKQ